MARRSEFVDFVLERMAPAIKPRVRAMFGGYGIYDGERMFAIVMNDTLYFKACAQTRQQFEQRGLLPMRYAARGKTIALQYFEAPPEVYEDGQAMRVWCAQAIQAAMGTRRAKAASEKPPRFS